MTDIYFFHPTKAVEIDRDSFERLAPVERSLFVLLAIDAGHGAALPARLGLSESAIQSFARQKHFAAEVGEDIEDVLSILKPIAWRVLDWLRNAGPQHTTYAGLCQEHGSKFPALRDSVAQLRDQGLIDFSSKGREGLRLAINARGVAALESKDA